MSPPLDEDTKTAQTLMRAWNIQFNELCKTQEITVQGATIAAANLLAGIARGFSLDSQETTREALHELLDVALDQAYHPETAIVALSSDPDGSNEG